MSHTTAHLAQLLVRLLAVSVLSAGLMLWAERDVACNIPGSGLEGQDVCSGSPAVSGIEPDSRHIATFFGSLYFVLITSATVGYGDQVA